MSALQPVENLRPLMLGRDGKPIHPNTVLRRIVEGVPVSDGEKVYLRAEWTGSGWLSKPEWVREFNSALTARKLAAERSRVPGQTAIG